MSINNPGGQGLVCTPEGVCLPPRLSKAKSLKNFFEPESIAVIGASRNPEKVGHVILRNIIDGGFEGNVFPVNPNAEEILKHKSFSSILKVEDKVGLAVIAVPAQGVLKVVKECNKKGVKEVLIISAGFSEVGNKDLEKKLGNYLKANKMRAIGVNCLGLFDSYNKLDAMFIPRYRLRRPKPGAISFVCQSGAIGAAILDKATEEDHKFSKFISYGNATDLDESDFLGYLKDDENTKVICLYLEGIKDGEKFYKTLGAVSKVKPVVVLKGGISEEGSEAALSHTGSMAGDEGVYSGIFKQTGTIQAGSLEEMFHIASLVEKGIKFKGSRVQIITNGGGYGIVSVDNISKAKNIELSSLSAGSVREMRKAFPKTVNIGNPLDLVGDATTERYRIALDVCLKDRGVDAILLIVLYQTPLITKNIVEVISDFGEESKKPIVVVSTGAEFTENLSRVIEKNGLPTFSYPKDAIEAIDKLIWYQKRG